MQRVQAGHVLVPNPLNRHQVSRVSLRPEDVAGIVFWSKNPAPLLSHLPVLDSLGYRYYVQFTITAYGRDLEPHTPTWRQSVDTFLRLSERMGPSRVVWRYDPIILTRALTPQYHLEMIARTAAELQGSGHRLVISFLDMYRKTRRNLEATHSPLLAGLREEPDEPTMRSLAADIAGRANDLGFEVQACAETLDLNSSGVTRGRCIDPELLDPGGSSIPYTKDPAQREACGCARSRDIGMYDSCPHGCAFCYANGSAPDAVYNWRQLHGIDCESLLELR